MISTSTNCRGREGQLQSSQQAGDRPRSPGPWRRTTKLYDRTGDESMLDEVKRIMISGSMPLCRWAGVLSGKQDEKSASIRMRKCRRIRDEGRA